MVCYSVAEDLSDIQRSWLPVKQHYIVTKDADMLAPDWLAVRINYAAIRFIHVLRDGAEILKGVKIGDQIAEIGDTVTFDGKRLSVERK